MCPSRRSPAARYPRPILTAVIASFAGATIAWAAEAPPAETRPVAATPSAPLVETITVTATSTPRRIEDTAATVGVVSRTQIEETMAADVRDLLLFEPGVQIDGSPARLGLSGFNIRGVGGNRVAMRVDGVPVPEQFAFGPLAAPRSTIDVDAVESVEILRSAGSALYGSDALGGVVSLVTRDPSDYLAGDTHRVGARLGWDGRADETFVAATTAASRGPWSASLAVEGRRGGLADNQGTVETEDATRTTPNPLDRRTRGVLGKLVADPRDDWRVKVSADLHREATEGDVFSSRTVQDLGPQFGTGVTYTLGTEDFDVDDTTSRARVAVESMAQLDRAPADSLVARVHGQRNRTDQRVLERVRTTQGGGPFGPLGSTVARRDGLFRFDQETVGGELQAKKRFGAGDSRVDQLVTYGVAYSRDLFDQLRTRKDIDATTGGTLPSSFAYPTKYFPESRSDELGVYVQDEIELLGGRLQVVPGVRYDRAALDADEHDALFLAGNPGAPAPTDADHAAFSPRLGAVAAMGGRWSVFAQYARGFRTAPYSDVNVGFTNYTSGYTTLPNPDLDPETSDNVEVGLRGGFARGSVSLAIFDNRYGDFIELAARGRNPATGLVEYQSRNVGRARIRGIELGGDARLGAAWSLRGAASWIEGEDRGTGRPLNTVPPPRLVAGATYRPERPWRVSIVGTYLFAKDDGDVDRTSIDQLATPAALVVDATATLELGARSALEIGVFNLFDETYFEWGDVQGIARTSPALDRYTSPGRTGAVRMRIRF